MNVLAAYADYVSGHFCHPLKKVFPLLCKKVFFVTKEVFNA